MSDLQTAFDTLHYIVGNGDRASPYNAPKRHATPEASIAARAAELIAAGRYVTPAIEYALLTPSAHRDSYKASDFDRTGIDINIFLGKQRSGRQLALIDLDSHHPAAARTGYQLCPAPG